MPTKSSLHRTLLFSLAIATLRSASLHADDATDVQRVFDDGSRQPLAWSLLENTSSHKRWREWMDELDQRPSIPATDVRPQADTWLPVGWPLPPESWPGQSVYFGAQRPPAPAASFTEPRALVLTTLTPQPQAAGQTLSIGPAESNGGNYTVSSSGETWNIVYLGNSGAGTLNHSAGTLTIASTLYMGIGGYPNSGTYNLSGSGVLSCPVENMGYTGTGTFNQNGGTNQTTTLNISNATANSASGTYNLNGGTLQAGTVLGARAGVFNFNGGTLQAASSTGSFLQGLASANVKTGGAVIDSNGYNVTIAQSLLHDTSSGAPATDGGLTKQGNLTLSFTGNNTYAGPTTVNAGTLIYADGGSSSGGGSITLNNGGRLLLNTSGTVTAGGLNFTDGNSTATLQAGALQITAGGTVGGGGGLIFQGGTLRAGGAFTIQSGLPISIQAGGGTVDTTGGNIKTDSGFGYSGGGAGVSTGTGTFTIQGGRTLTADFTNNSSWTGPVVVNGSGTTLRNNGGNYTLTGGLTVNTGAFYDLNNSSASFGGLSGAGTVLNTGGAGGVKTLTVTGAGGGTFSGGIAPTGGATEAANTALTLNLNRGGVLTLSGANTYTGATTINAGNTLQLGNGGTSGSLAAGSAVLDNGALVFNRSDALTAAFSISGSGSVTQTGTGTLTLSGANTYTGATTINAGILQAGAATSAFGNGSVLTLANVAGATLNLNNFNETVGSLAGGGSTGGNVALGSGTLTAGGNNASTTFGGAISGTGGLTKTGSGTLTLTGNNTYTGATTLAGTVQVGSGGTTGSLGSGAVTNNGALVFNRTDGFTVASALGGTGSLTMQGTGTLTLSGNNTYTGATTLAAGTLNVDGAGALGSAGTLAFTGGTLQYSSASTSDYASRFSTANNQIYNLDTNGQNVTLATALTSSGGSLTKLGAGTLTLTGNNTYTGATMISAGTLAVGGSASVAGGGSLSVLTGGTLALGGTGKLSMSGETIGDASAVTASLGTFTQTAGTNTVSGALTIGAGTYSLSGTGALSAANETVGSSGATTSSNGVGTFTHTAGTNTVSGTLYVGDSASSVSTHSTYSLSGTGALSAANETIGCTTSNAQYPGLGNFQQSGGTNTVTSTLTVGYRGSSSYSAASMYSLSGTGALSAATESIGSSGAGTFTHTAGTNTISSGLIVGDTNPGTYSLSGTGVLSAANETVGSNGVGTFTHTAGTNTVSNAFNVGTGTYSLSGTGALSAATESIGRSGAGTFNQSGGTNVVSGALSFGNNGNGTYILSGGTVRPGSVTGSNGGTSTFNFNGGTLQAAASSTSFFQGLTAANVQGGGALIDTQGYNVTVAQNLVNNTANGTSDSGLTKLGSGTLTLAGANTFNGPLNINAGIVAASSESNLGAAASPLTVGGSGQLLFTGNATLARTYNLGVSTLAVASGQTLTLAAATVNNGIFTGPGTGVLANGTTLNGTRAGGGATLSQRSGTAAFNNVTLSGNSTFTQAAGAVLNTTGDFITTPQATVTVNGTVNAAGGSLSGGLTVNNGGALNTGGASAPLYLDGSRGTTINAGGQLNAASGSTVELGGLLVNNGAQTGTLNVNLGGVARGTGTFGTVNVGQGGYFGPNALTTSNAVKTNALAQTAGSNLAGVTPGAANIANLALGSGSVLAVSLQDARGGAGVGYDTAQVQGALTLGAYNVAGDQITVNLASLGSNGAAGSAANFDPSQSFSFVLATTNGGITGFDAASFAVDTSAFQNSLGSGHFFVAQDGNNLDLNFTPVPEPATWAGGALLLGAAGLTLRRRLRFQKATGLS